MKFASIYYTLLVLSFTLVSCVTDTFPNCDYIVEDNIAINGVKGKFQILKKSQNGNPLICQYIFRKQLEDGKRKVIFNFYDLEYISYEVLNDSLYLYSRLNDTAEITYIRYGLDEL